MALIASHPLWLLAMLIGTSALAALAWLAALLGGVAALRQRRAAA